MTRWGKWATGAAAFVGAAALAVPMVVSAQAPPLRVTLSGANEAADHLKKKLGVDWNETTGDGRYTLKQGECFGACGDAPVLLVNDKKMASFMTPENIDKLLAELK